MTIKSHPVLKTVLLEPVHAVIQEVFTSREFPVSWFQAAVSAVVKMANPACKEFCRGAVVRGYVYGKVFRMVLAKRLSAWAEELGTGHRHKLASEKAWHAQISCSSLILSYALGKCQHQEKQLFYCLVGVTKQGL
jgi:hypothetical protein